LDIEHLYFLRKFYCNTCDSVHASYDTAVSYALDYRSNLMEIHSLFIELLHADR